MGAHILAQNAALAGLGQSPTPDGNTSKKAKKSWAAAQSFEQVLVNNLLSQAFSGVKGDGPLGTEGTGTETWRSMLVNEHAKSIKLGVSNNIYAELMKVQEHK